MYANIIVDISHEKLDKTFQYIIPEKLIGKIEPGVQVLIPFGVANKLITGYVLECTSIACIDVSIMKSIDSIIEKQICAEGNMIRLASWMREQYGSTMINAMKTVLPVKKTVKGLLRKTIVSNLNEKEWFSNLVLWKKTNGQKKTG